VSDLKGQVALVTGSTRGIGAAIARLFAKNGARVVVHGRDSAALAAVAASITQEGGEALPLTADVTKLAELERLREQVSRQWGPIDILIANAGGSSVRPGPMERLSEEDWRRSIDGNLTATFLTIKSVLPSMKTRRRGVILTMSSAAARRPHPQSPIAYAAAKAGIQMLTQHLAAQVGPFGIRVNCLAPEIILTERNEQQIPAAQQEALAAAHPLERLGVPDDVANAALFLVSEEASWLTGLILDVAGGAVMG
jgi:3-oxoacyl-[acyl-carrier protein] reductase